MNRLAWLATVAALALPQAIAPRPLGAQTPTGRPASSQGQPAAGPVDCSPRGSVQFICIPTSEDIFYISGSDWALLGTRGFRAINVKDRSVVPLYPAETAKEVPDTKTYPNCNAVTGDEKARFGLHGISVTAGSRAGTYTVYGSHPSTGERVVDVFELDLTGRLPSTTWIGCINAAEPISLNGIVALPEGGFLATNWQPRGAAGAELRPKMEQGAISGEVLEWHDAATGFVKVPGTEGAGVNGIEISKDGTTIFVNEWGAKKFWRITRGANPPKIEKITLGFRGDNIHWAPDGMLLVAGHTNPDQAPLPPSSRIVKIDPNTLQVTELLNLPDTPEFQHSTGAAQIGNEVWVSTARSARLAVFAVPK